MPSHPDGAGWAWDLATGAGAGGAWAGGGRGRGGLAAAGPVRWPLKEALFERLVADPAWHPHIRGAIDASASDVYGKLGASAPAWLARLRR